jgi:glucosylceramidase
MTRQVLRLVAIGAAVAVGLTGFTEAQAGESAAARVWVTTVDGTELMHERAPVAFGRPVAGNPNVTITVDPSRE